MQDLEICEAVLDAINDPKYSKMDQYYFVEPVNPIKEIFTTYHEVIKI